MDSHEKDKLKARWAALSVVSNALLVLFKVVVGLVSGSVSIIAEAVHSGNDLLASIIAYFAVQKATQPADEKHPFGHGKFENLAGLVESALIVVAGGVIIFQSIEKLRHPGEVQHLDLGIGVMAVAALVNFFVSQKLIRIAKKTDSVALETDGAHLMVDVYTSLGVMGGLVLIRLTKLAVLDPLVSLGIALYIVYLGIHLSIKSTRDLLDEQLPNEEVDAIRKLLVGHEKQIADHHGLATRRSAGTRMVEVHLVVCASWSVQQGHDAGITVRKAIQQTYPDARVVFHVDPCKEECESCAMVDCSGRKPATASA